MSTVTTLDNDNQKNSVNETEINHFNALATQWWNRNGPMSPLHEMNELRVNWISNELRKHHYTLQNTHILDIGCGAGLACEGMATLGYNVLGVDAGKDVIAAAQHHLETVPLPPKSGHIIYRNGNVEELLEENQKYPVINALELIEHVNDPGLFLQNLSSLLPDQGLIFVSTINRNLRSFLFAKVAAEYIARKLPIGTHNWKQFITPSELGRMANNAGLRINAIAGLSMFPNRWKITNDVSINYITCLTK